MNLLESAFTDQQEKKDFRFPDGSFVYTPIKDTVGNNRVNQDDDVMNVRRGFDYLNYTTEEDQHPEIYTRGLDSVIKNFQMAENLKVDGFLKPMGETEQKLQSRLKEKALPSLKILKSIDDQRTVNTIKEEEGEKNYIYLDPLGNPTTGVGFLLPGVAVAKKYPFYNTKEKRLATPEEIEKVYNTVQVQKYGQKYGADNYQKYNNGIELRQEDIDKQLHETLRSKVQEVRKKFSGFDDVPGDVQLAILDMQFNIGDARFRPSYIDPKTGQERGWPEFFKAYHRKDWKGMAKESHRKDVHERRNMRIHDLLYNAK